jgi:hypothetical protein
LMLFEFDSIFLGNLKNLQLNYKKAIGNRSLEDLKSVIDSHNKLTELFLEFKRIFAPFIFYKFLSAGCTICFLVFQILQVRISLISPVQREQFSYF